MVYTITGSNIPLPCDDRDSKWKKGPTYNQDDWARYTATDLPFGFDWQTAGAMQWQDLNQFWEG